MLRVLLSLPSSMDFSLGHVRSTYCARDLIDNWLRYIDIGLLAHVIGSTADNDSEIGARLGVCFTFTGKNYSLKPVYKRILNYFHRYWWFDWYDFYRSFRNLSEMKFELLLLLGTPIAGALLTSSFIWWRPSLFSGICVSSGVLCFCISRFLIARRKGVSWLWSEVQDRL